MSEVLTAPQRPRRFRSTRTIVALILREMSTTYGRSPGGYLWAVLEPAGAIAVLSLIFSYGFRTPALGTNFALFFATGILPFGMYTDISSKLAAAIRFSRSLLAYPAVKYTDTLIARLTLSFLTQLMIFYIFMIGLHLIYDLNTILRVGPIVSALAMAVSIGVGVGTINCFLFAIFPLWQRVWTIVTRPLFLLSGVIFMYEKLPEFAQEVLWWNPLMHMTGMMRRGFYATYDAAYVEPLYVFSLSGALSLFGLLLLHRHHVRIMNA